MLRQPCVWVAECSESSNDYRTLSLTRDLHFIFTFYVLKVVAVILYVGISQEVMIKKKRLRILLRLIK